MIPNRTSAWRAVAQRDRTYDGKFVYAVSSTRIYCRPSCASRRPTRSGVEFFETPALAERAGFRACKRCKPTSLSAPLIERAVTQASQYIAQHADERITLATLARNAGVSASHLQREFKRILGVSPREFQTAERHRRLGQRLRKGDTVSRASFDAGFGSSSRVYERAAESLGMTPAAVRRGGAGQRIQFSVVGSPFGRLLVAWTERGVCSVAFGDDDAALEHTLRTNFAKAEIRAAGPAIHEWVDAIVRSLRGDTMASSVPTDVQGTAFQRRVWRALQRIPRGTTLSYSQVAGRIGKPSAARAVARACATNPVALVVPCHRVVREDGDLGGYRWGMDRKRELLAAERE